jgi:hypothetical protein
MIIIPLVGCTNGDDTKTTTTNPIVALQEDVDELNDNFNTEVANIKSRLSTLETSSIPANITNRVATLEANVAALQVTVNALSAGSSVDLTALTKAVNDIADDVLEVNSNIDVISGNIDAINLDITDLKNKYNSITIPDYDSRIQEVELRIVSILSSVQNYGTDITDIKADIVDMIDDIALNTNDISVLYDELNKVIIRLSAVENATETVSITEFWDGSNYLKFKTNKAGNYAVVITLYGEDLNNISSVATFGLSIDKYVYANNGICNIILELPEIGNPLAPQNWQANKEYSIQFSGAGFNVKYTTIEIAMR